MRSQHGGESTHLTTTHGVGLTRQREWAGSRLADMPGDQIQADECQILINTNGALVESHCP